MELDVDRPAGARDDRNPDAAGYADDEGEPDGRRLRRARNRDAVVDALLDLFREGVLNPSTDEIAERAGLSPRSLFRYFDDVEDLTRAALARAESRTLPLLVIRADVDDPLEVRVDALVAQRMALFGAFGRAASVSRLRAPFQPVVAEGLADHRRFLADQVRRILGPELERLEPDVAELRLAAADVLTSFEAYQLLVEARHLDAGRAAAAMRAGILGLLALAPDASRSGSAAAGAGAAR
jgi:AcrR family transcriptional regulator